MNAEIEKIRAELDQNQVETNGVSDIIMLVQLARATGKPVDLDKIEQHAWEMTTYIYSVNSALRKKVDFPLYHQVLNTKNGKFFS